jgi:Bacterial dipeptidyl-peptidase Sh3 domain/NlpC/P60 family
VDVAPLRADPDDDAEQVTQALRGEPLRVEEHRGSWARVVTAYNYPAWVRTDALEEGEGVWPATVGGSPVELARGYLGAPYLWGGMTEAGIDCSGLVHMAYRRGGRLVPRDAWEQLAAGAPVREPEPGDLVSTPTPAPASTTSRSGSARGGSCTPPAETASAWLRRTSLLRCRRVEPWPRGSKVTRSRGARRAKGLISRRR